MSVYPHIPPLSSASADVDEGLAKDSTSKSAASLASLSSSSASGRGLCNSEQAPIHQDEANQNAQYYQHGKQHPFGSLTNLGEVTKNGVDLLVSPSLAENGSSQRSRECASYAGSTSSFQQQSNQRQLTPDRNPYRMQPQYGIPKSQSNAYGLQPRLYGGTYSSSTLPPMIPYSNSNRMQFYPQDSGSLWISAPHSQYRPTFQHQMNGMFGNNSVIPRPIGPAGGNSGGSLRPASPISDGYPGNPQQVPTFTSSSFSDDVIKTTSTMKGGGGGMQSQLHGRRESMMIDKFQPLKMVRNEINGTCTKAEEYFRTVENRSGALVVSWPSTVDQVAAQTKMRPGVSIELCGAQQAIEVAETLISHLLGSEMHRVTLHMYVTFAEHSHIIGKGGNNVKTVSEDTKCHVHFPDCNRNAKPQGKSTLVTITGGLPGADVTRQRVRSLLPLNFMFDVPLQNASLPGINEIKAHVESAQNQFRIAAALQTHERTCGHFILVRGPQDDRTLKGVQKVLHYFAGRHDTKHIEVRTSLKVLPQHQYHMRDPSRFVTDHPSTLGKYVYKQTCRNSKTPVEFPLGDTTGSSHNMLMDSYHQMPPPPFLTPSTVLIYGLPVARYDTWMVLQALLPIKLVFDVKTTQEFLEPLVHHIRDNLHVDIQFRTRYHNECKTITPPQIVSMAIIERNISSILEARRQLLHHDEPEVPVDSIREQPVMPDFDYALLRDDMTANSTLRCAQFGGISVEKLPDSQLTLSINYNPMEDNKKLARPCGIAVIGHNAMMMASSLEGTYGGLYDNTFSQNGVQQLTPYGCSGLKGGENMMNAAFNNLRIGNEMPLGRPMPPSSSANYFSYYSVRPSQNKQQKTPTHLAEMFVHQKKLPNYAGAVNSISNNNPVQQQHDAVSDADTPTLDAFDKHREMVNNASCIGSFGGASDNSSATLVSSSKKQQQSPLFAAAPNITTMNNSKRSSFCQPTSDYKQRNHNNNIPSHQQLQTSVDSSGSDSFCTNSSGFNSPSAGGGLLSNNLAENGLSGGGVLSNLSGAIDASCLISDTENGSGANSVRTNADVRQRLLPGQGFGPTNSNNGAGSSPPTRPTAAPFVCHQAGDILASGPPSNMPNQSPSTNGTNSNAIPAFPSLTPQQQAFWQQYVADDNRLHIVGSFNGLAIVKAVADTGGVGGVPVYADSLLRVNDADSSPPSAQVHGKADIIQHQPHDHTKKIVVIGSNGAKLIEVAVCDDELAQHLSEDVLQRLLLSCRDLQLQPSLQKNVPQTSGPSTPTQPTPPPNFVVVPKAWERLCANLHFVDNIVCANAVWSTVNVALGNVTRHLAEPKRGVFVVRWLEVLYDDDFLEHVRWRCPREVSRFVKQTIRCQMDFIEANWYRNLYAGKVDTLIVGLHSPCPEKADRVNFHYRSPRRVRRWSNLLNELAAVCATSVEHLLFLPPGRYSSEVPQYEIAAMYRRVRIDAMLANMPRLRTLYLNKLSDIETAFAQRRRGRHDAWKALKCVAAGERLSCLTRLVIYDTNTTDLTPAHGCTMPQLPSFDGQIELLNRYQSRSEFHGRTDAIRRMAAASANRRSILKGTAFSAARSIVLPREIAQKSIEDPVFDYVRTDDVKDRGLKLSTLMQHVKTANLSSMPLAFANRHVYQLTLVTDEDRPQQLNEDQIERLASLLAVVQNEERVGRWRLELDAQHVKFFVRFLPVLLPSCRLLTSNIDHIEVRAKNVSLIQLFEPLCNRPTTPPRIEHSPYVHGGNESAMLLPSITVRHESSFDQFRTGGGSNSVNKWRALDYSLRGLGMLQEHLLSYYLDMFKAIMADASEAMTFYSSDDEAMAQGDWRRAVYGNIRCFKLKVLQCVSLECDFCRGLEEQLLVLLGGGETSLSVTSPFRRLTRITFTLC